MTQQIGGWARLASLAILGAFPACNATSHTADAATPLPPEDGGTYAAQRDASRADARDASRPDARVASRADAGDASLPDAGDAGSVNRVVIGPELTACEEHLDCQLVETACSQCCMPGAIAVDRREDFQAAFEDACRDYQGGICDCAPPDVVPRCYDRACVAVARADVVDCFSTIQNTWNATAADAVGCPCDMDEPSACTSMGALECVQALETAAPSWRAVDDPSCLPRKLADAAAPDEANAVTVHLFVLPYNALPLPLDVWLNGVHVVTGYFEYGPPNVDPGRIYDFRVIVAGPTVTLRAEAPDATLQESIDVPATRWVILDYGLAEGFTLQVSDSPVGFD